MRAPATVVLLALFLALFWWSLAADDRGETTARATGAGAAAAEPRGEIALAAPAPEPVEVAPASAEVARERVERPTTAELRVVDSRTGEPVPEVRVAIADLPEDVVTDGDGRATLSQPLPAGTVVARVSDLGVTVAVLQREWSGAGKLVWTLPVPIGPTYVLRLEPQIKAPVPVTWSARLVETTLPAGVAGELLVGADGLSLARREPDREWSWQAQREGERAWVRYPLAEHERDEHLRHVLVVRAEGWADVELDVRSTVGVHGPLFAPFTVQIGNVAGRVRNEEETPVAGATILLLPASRPPEEVTPVWERALTAGDGSYAFERVAAAAHDLVAFAPGHRAARIPLDVRPGGAPSDVTLPRDGTFDSLVLHGRSGGVEASSRLYVRAGLLDAMPYGRLFLERGYGRGANVRLTRLSGGRYGVAVTGFGGPPPFRRHAFVADTPYVDKHADVIPASELQPIRFVVTGVRDGSEVRDASVFCGPEGTVYTGHGDLVPGAPLRMPPGAPFTWTVAAREHAPAHGDQDDVRVEAGERVLRVPLRPGWGVSMFFRAGDPLTFAEDPGPWRGWTFPAASTSVGLLAAPPLPAVEVLADGLPVGRSDANGALRLAMGGVPLRLTLRCEGWRLAAVERAGTGLDDRHVVWLAREPR